MAAWSRHSSLSAAATSSGIMASHVHRRLAVTATASGLHIRPFDDDPAFEGPAVRIAYGSKPRPELTEYKEGAEMILVVDGIAGVLQGPGKHAYIIFMIDSPTAATLLDSRESKIQSVADLVALPLSDFEAARTTLAKFAVKQAAVQRRRAASVSTSGTVTETEDGSETDEDDDGGSATGTDTEADAQSRPPSVKEPFKRPFWTRPPFLQRKPSTPSPAPSSAERSPAADSAAAAAEEATSAAMSDSTTPSEPADMPLDQLAAAAASPADAEGEHDGLALDEKVLAELMRTMRGMYFSMDADITRSLQHKHEIVTASSSNKDEGSGLVEPNPTLPLWRRADRRFFWNAALVAPFIEAGLHAYIIPLMQGFVGQVSVSLPLQQSTQLSSARSAPSSITLELILITRRSIERPGLRYQRRGVNQNGGVANFCESEFIVGARPDVGGPLHVASFVQTRGSIPLHWGQSPWALKPAPILEQPMEASLPACKKHFETQKKHYGRQVVVNLAETTGKEGVVVNAYRDAVEAMEDEQVKYVEFDFHHECKGMKYENIGKLISSLHDDLEDMQSYWATEDRVLSEQHGSVRTNCIDCLDRTNVVQSAIARTFLNRHLVHLGITSQEEAGMHDGLDFAFNGLWADNGDAISREYSGTSALKGDFTRTGKRNWRGAINDMNNSVARLLQSTVTDFFRQACLDYVLGVNANSFVDFSEGLAAKDPGHLLRLRQIRAEAIETSASQILVEGEVKVAAWTLLSPVEPSVVRSPKNRYQEKILLVSNRAVYAVEYDFNLQKVVSFLRIPSGDLVSLQLGAYILQSLEPAQRDPTENYGLLIKYREHSAVERVHTYTMRSFKLSPTKEKSVLDSPSKARQRLAEDSANPPKFLAFKALRRDVVRLNDGQSRIIERRDEQDSGTEGAKTAKELVESIVGVLKEEAEKLGASEEGDDSFVVEKDIISLADSKANTTIADRLSRSLSKAIWW